MSAAPFPEARSARWSKAPDQAYQRAPARLFQSMPRALRPVPPLPLEDLLRRGFERLARHDEQGAATDFSRATELAPARYEAWLGLAAALAGAGDRAKALEAAERAIALQPEDGRARSIHGFCLTTTGRLDEAADEYAKVTELAPLEPLPYFNGAVALRRRKRPHAALELLEKATERGVTDQRVLRLKGMVHMELDQPRAALDAFDAVLAADAADDAAVEGRIWALRRLGELAQARELIDDRLEAGGERSDLLSVRGWLLIDEGDPAGALRWFRQALRRDKENATALHGKVACLRLLGDFERADQAVDAALQRMPGDPALRNERGWLSLDQGRPDDALDAFDRVLAADAENEFALVGKARSLRLLERCDEASGALDRVPAARRDTARYQAERALLALARHDTGGGRAALRDAVRAFEAWLEHEPRDPIAHAGLGIATWRLRRKRDAVRCLEAALEHGTSHPRELDIRLWLGDLRRELGDRERARAEYERAIQLDPAAARAELKLAELLEAGGETAQAIEHFARAADLGDPHAHLWLAHGCAGEGRYDAAREHWASARGALDARRAAGASLSAADHYHLACVLLYVDGAADEAEQVLRAGLERASAAGADDADLWAVLLCLLLDRATTQPAAQRGSERQQAAEAYRQATRALRVRAAEGDVQSLVRLAELHLATERDAEAKACLAEALERDSQNGAAFAALATAHARGGDHDQAVVCLKEAVRCDEHDLTLRSRLGVALFHAGRYEQAEQEYRRVLSVSPQHLESLAGLGELYSRLGDAREDPDFYEHAVDRFSAAIELACTGRGSKRLRRAELADVLYARGYARVRLYESSATGTHEDQLRKAEQDFQRCADLDGTQHGAVRARAKVRKRLERQSAQAFGERVGPVVIASLALVVFGLTQASLVAGAPMATMSASVYAALSFGALLFVLAGVCLPRLLRIRIAGMELEKSTLEQAPAPTPLGIHTQAMRPPSPQSALSLLTHREALPRVEPALADWMSGASQPAAPDLALTAADPDERARDAA